MRSTRRCRQGLLCGLLAGARPGQDAKGCEREQIAHEIEKDEKLGQVGTRMRKIRTSLATKSVAEIGAENQLKTKSASLRNLSPARPPDDSESSLFLFLLCITPHGDNSERDQQHAPVRRRDAAS